MQIAIIFNQGCWLVSKFAQFSDKKPPGHGILSIVRIFALQSTTVSLNVIRQFIDKEPCRALRYLR
jgi:hypothetical protein